MRLAVMQPYFFPYPGYFQLIKAADKFVVFDDVQYINRGWINRNRILLNNKCFNIVMPVRRDSTKKNINERYFVEDSLKHKTKLLLQVEHAYSKAPFFEQIFPVVSRLLFYEEKNVSKYNTVMLSELCKLLKIGTPFYFSSELNIQNGLSGEERMIKINEVMCSTVYINLVGGSKLYSKKAFLNKEIDLIFLKTGDYCYNQFDNCFVPDLSIIDLLMFNSIESANKILDKYQLVQI